MFSKKDPVKRPQTSKPGNQEIAIPKSILNVLPKKVIGCNCCLYFMCFRNVITKQRIPLKSLGYEVEIVDSLAYITINQEYFNDDQIKTIETEFLFSIANEACFYDFEAKIGDIIIKGEIKEKEEAKSEYQANLKKGNMVAYSEISSEQQDIVKIKVGNIPPLTSVTIKFKYLQQLDICLNKFWRLTIPSTLTPRYQSRHQVSKDSEVKNIGNLPEINPQEKYPWTIKTIITSSSTITFMKSPSHSIVSEYLDKTQTKCVISFQNEEVPNKDFTILFKNDAINKPNWILAQKDNEEEYPFCAMLSFFPQFNAASDNDAYEAFLQNSVKNDFKISALKSKGEFIFVLDRSGSMKGRRIDMAKQALILFLKSMPPDSYFNIVSFGTRFRFMFFKGSHKYSEEKVEAAIKDINSFQADYGGTELIDPLREIFKNYPIKNYPRNVFLLTDGAISNTNQVVELIAKNNENCRVYTIGIGNGCSRELITEGGIAGKGKYEFIGDNEDMNAKIISLLQDSLTPFLTDIKLEYDKTVVEMISPLPESIQFIRKNEALYFYVFFNRKFSDSNQSLFKLSFDDSLKKERQSEEINIQANDFILKEDLIHRFGVYNLIKTASRSISYEQDYNKDVYIAKKHDIDQFCLHLALKFQILTTFTAFICVIQEKDPNDPSVFIRKKVEIPSLVSVDHSQIYRQDQEKISNLNVMNLYCKSMSLQTGGMPQERSMVMTTSRPMMAMAKNKSSLASACRSFQKLEKKELLSESKTISKDKMISEKASILKMEEEETKNEAIGEKTENKDHLMKILAKQKLGGYWEVKVEVISMLGITSEQIFDKMPKEIEKKEIWLTIVILCFLELRFQKNQGSWTLISQKAVEYLEDNNVNYELFKQIAMELLI